RAAAAERQEVFLHGARRAVRPHEARADRQAAGGGAMITRRALLRGLAAAPFAARSALFAQQTPAPRVDAAALRRRIEALSAFGRMDALAAAGARTRHPLEMVVWAHEESYAFSRGLACSRIAAGDVSPADMDEVWNGMRRADAIRRIGGDPSRIHEARRA